MFDYIKMKSEQWQQWFYLMSPRLFNLRMSTFCYWGHGRQNSKSRKQSSTWTRFSKATNCNEATLYDVHVFPYQPNNKKRLKQTTWYNEIYKSAHGTALCLCNQGFWCVCVCVHKKNAPRAYTQCDTCMFSTIRIYEFLENGRCWHNKLAYTTNIKSLYEWHTICFRLE